MNTVFQRGTDHRIFAGDTVVIECQGETIRGIVHDAQWYGGDDGWCIALSDERGKRRVWNQHPDGGRLVQHNRRSTR